MFHKVILYGFTKDYYDVTGAKDKKIEFHCLGDRLPKGISIPELILRPIILFLLLLKILTYQKYDIVHIQGHLPLFFLLLPLLKFKRKKICWSLHDVDIRPSFLGIRGKLESFYFSALTQLAIVSRSVDAIIVLGSLLKENLTMKGVAQEKIHVIPHFDYRYLLKYDFKASNDYVLIFGRIMKYKGIETFVDAAKIVHDHGYKKCQFLIAGKWSDPSYLPKIMTEDMKFIQLRDETIPISEIPHIFGRAIVVVLPYTTASQSGVLPLAYTFSKPVIASNVGSLGEFVEHGKTGYLFEPGNSKQLANYIIDLLDDNSKCMEMGRNGYKKMVKEMSLEKCVDEINKIYETV